MNEEAIHRAKVFFEQDYRERGKIKWNGFFLSDHTQKINRTKQASQEQLTWLEETPIYDMQFLCKEAFTNHRKVLVQVNKTSTDQQPSKYVIEKVNAFDECGFWSESKHYHYELVRHLEVIK
ncbi:hypothetical protein [Fructobacillus fructosus]|uniref:hypothetical protein n=1 Tax=Fructobacillus fructosus TaxID=1631 RepID=UPI00165899C0|nr:hypothetical protein [Fructobacillus fructosus]MBC9119304.1 hypothetical protein [Fructobacillus fructosus]MBD9366869.1 hypothetical protein [Leuconostoc mesenteroides]